MWACVCGLLADKPTMNELGMNRADEMAEVHGIRTMKYCALDFPAVLSSLQSVVGHTARHVKD